MTNPQKKTGGAEENNELEKMLSVSLSDRLVMELERLEQGIENRDTNEIFAKKLEKIAGLSILALERLLYTVNSAENLTEKEIARIISAIEKTVTQISRLKSRFETPLFEKPEISEIVEKNPKKLLASQIAVTAKRIAEIEVLLEQADWNHWSVYRLLEAYKEILSEFRKLVSIALEERRWEKTYRLQKTKLELEKEQFEWKKKAWEKELEWKAKQAEIERQFAIKKAELAKEHQKELLKERYNVKLEFERKAKELEKQVDTNAVTAEDILRAINAYKEVYENGLREKLDGEGESPE